MTLSVVLWIGMASLVAAAAARVWTWKRPRPVWRARATLGLAGAAGLAVLALAWPAGAPQTVSPPVTALDQYAPSFQFHEVHSVVVEAPADRVRRAVHEVTADEILLFRTLTWMRRFGREGRGDILDPAGDMPLLEVATRTSFLRLHEDAHEVVIGTIVVAPPGLSVPKQDRPEWFRLLAAAGTVKATMNFRLQPLTATRTRVTTETRVFATDAATARRFAVYWRVILPGSALIRVMWLRAIRLRAEG